MLETREIGDWNGFLLRLENANLIIIRARKGIVACAYLSVETAEKLGDALAIVTGVSTFEDVLDAEIVQASPKAREFGVRKGMTGREALGLLS